MFRILSTLALTLALTTVSVSAQTTMRPGSGQNTPTPILLPPTGLAIVQEEPMKAPEPIPGRPVEYGGFKPLEISEPTIEELYGKGYATTRIGLEDIGAEYIRYIPGGKYKSNRDPIIIVGAPGQDLFGLVETIDLREEARIAGRALLAVTMPITPDNTVSRSLSNRLQETVRVTDNISRVGYVLDTVLKNENLFAAPTLIGAEGTGSLFQSYLCQVRISTQMPKGVFLFDGGLTSQDAAGCNPPTLPRLVFYKDISDTISPYEGGTTTTTPGQSLSEPVLSASTTRSLWAIAGRCDAKPSLTWLPITKGRLAMETHNNCRSGGPVTLLSLIDGNIEDEQKTILVRLFLNGNLTQ